MNNMVKMAAVKRMAGIIALVALIGFSMAACDTGGGGGGSSNPFVGTWKGNFGGVNVTLVCSDSTWTATVPGEGTLNGTYTYSGKTATFKEGNDVVMTGTVSADGKTLTGLVYDGTSGSLTKQ